MDREGKTQWNLTDIAAGATWAEHKVNFLLARLAWSSSVLLEVLQLSTALSYAQLGCKQMLICNLHAV